MAAAGVFSVPSYITVGDEYDKTVPKDQDRTKGVQMKSGGPPNMFDNKYKSLSEGDKYIDPGAVEKKERSENSKKNITQSGFRYSSPPKRSSGLGSNFGCINETGYKHETEYMVVKKGEKPKQPAPAPRNMVTNPPKKGTYGTPGTTLGKGDEYRYISDPFDKAARAAEKSVDGKASTSGGGPAFKAACRKTDYFDSQPNVAASRVYSLDRPLLAKKPDPPPPKVVTAHPWKPTGPSRKGYNATITPLVYREDPYDLKEAKERDVRKSQKAAVVWKPVGPSKSLATRSIAFNHAAADTS